MEYVWAIVKDEGIKNDNNSIIAVYKYKHKSILIINYTIFFYST